LDGIERGTSAGILASSIGELKTGEHMAKKETTAMNFMLTISLEYKILQSKI
jgi:hypothetical protein